MSRIAACLLASAPWLPPLRKRTIQPGNAKQTAGPIVLLNMASNIAAPMR